MRTIRLALVLLALAVFIGATMAAAAAATPTPKAISSPTKMPRTMGNSMPSLVGLPTQATAGGLGFGGKSLDAAGGLSSNAVKNKAAVMTGDTQKKIATNAGKSSAKLMLPAMGPVASPFNNMHQMPAMSPINMPDWTSPGIILTI